MRNLLLIIIFMAISHAVMAKTWVIDYDKSYLGFIAKQGDQTIKGRFRKFDAVIKFDPADPETGKITANINVASFLTQNPEADGNLPQTDWFDTKKFPQATFSTTFVEADKNASCYKANSSLTLKGINKNVGLHFCLTPEGDHMRAKGEVVLLRNDFGVGLGPWAEEAVVANPVTVTIDIVAR